MPPRTRLLLIGHSHSNCIASALQAVEGPRCEWRHIHLSITDKHLKRGNPSIDLDGLRQKTFHIVIREAKALAGYTGSLEAAELPKLLSDSGITLVMTIRGIAHVTSGLIQPPVPYDVILKDEPDLAVADGAELVPYHALRQTYRARNNAALLFIEALSELTGGKAVAVAFPPPIGDDDVVYRGLGRFFTERYQDGFKIVPPMLRYKLWRVCISLYQESCDKAGIPYRMPPSGTMVDGRFLHPDAYHTDSVHANAWYGEQVLADLFTRNLV